jgi:dUTP pyrophosphatase
MKINIVKLHDRAQIPQKQTKGASGFDIHALDDVTIDAGGTALVRTGLAFGIPEGYEMEIRPRSGLSLNSKLRIANAPGTIDSDFTGELFILVDNISNNTAGSYKIKAGDRIAQGVFKKVEEVEIIEAQEIKETERGDGSLGSTGV